MSQELRVLQCFNCHIFQVDIVKKSAKWQCRVCNTKQSVRKELFRGTGKECRFKVQKLNMAKGQTNNETLYNIVEFLDEINDNGFENYSNCDEFSTDNFGHIVGNDQSEVMENKYQHPSPNNKFDVINFSQTKKWSAKASKKNMKTSSEINATSSKYSKWDSYL